MAPAFWWGLIPAALFAYPIFAFLRSHSRHKISEFAPEAHQAKQGTPAMGGLIIVLGLIPAVGYLASGGQPEDWWWRPALILLIGFGIIGIIDDYFVPKLMPGKRGLGWKQKLLMQLIVAVVASMGMYSSLGQIALSAFVILFFSNAFNFADGLDALAGTLLLGLTLGIGSIAWLAGDAGTTAPLMALIAGATIPFLYLNAPPAKIFMGDVGSLPIGALLGAAVCRLPLITDPTGHPSIFGMDAHVVMAVKVVSLMMAVELLPVPLQIFWVKTFKRRLFPFTPIHHAFERAGWKETRVVALFALTQLMLSILAITVMVLR